MSCLRCYQKYLCWYQEEINSVIFVIPPWNLVFNNPQILSIIISRILWWWIFRSLHIPAPETFSISESGTSQVFGLLTFYQLSWEKNCLDYLNWSRHHDDVFNCSSLFPRNSFFSRPVSSFSDIPVLTYIKKQSFCLLKINSWCIFVIFIYIFGLLRYSSCDLITKHGLHLTTTFHQLWLPQFKGSKAANVARLMLLNRNNIREKMF